MVTEKLSQEMRSCSLGLKGNYEMSLSIVGKLKEKSHSTIRPIMKKRGFELSGRKGLFDNIQ